MKAPIIYRPDFIGRDIAALNFELLWDRLDWVRIGSTPRREYYVNRLPNPQPYSYGSGEFARTYQPQPMTPIIDIIWELAEVHADCKFDVCFLNGYESGKDHLGWHADDSPEMDDDRPIAIVSLGADREIWFRPNEAEVQRLVAAHPAVGEDPETAQHNVQALAWNLHQPEKLLLESGSLCLMQPGMQDTHQHRIPKSPRHDCGPRISFTFRGYKA